MASVVLECSCSVPLDVKVITVNDPFMPLVYLVYQLKCDSVHGRLNGTIAMSEVDGNGFLMSRLVRVHVLCFRTLTFTTPTYAAAAQRTRDKVNKREVAAWVAFDVVLTMRNVRSRCTDSGQMFPWSHDLEEETGYLAAPWLRGLVTRSRQAPNTVGEHDRTEHAERHALLSIASVKCGGARRGTGNELSSAPLSSRFLVRRYGLEDLSCLPSAPPTRTVTELSCVGRSGSGR